jgi:hypothetical protein
MNKLLVAAALTVALASPALAAGMASDSMSGVSHMTHGDGMKMAHKKPAKTGAMTHDGGMSSGMMGASGSGAMSAGAMKTGH